MRRLVVLGTLTLIIALLVIAQLVLPYVAAQQIRDRLSKHGKVTRVEVSAFPAIELLWHRADKVQVTMQSYRSSTPDLAGNLAQVGNADSLDASVGVLDTGLLTLHNARLKKRGDQLTGTATVTQAALRAAIPFLDSVQPVASGNGTLIVRGTATILGVTASVDATVQAQNGSLVIAPNVPLGSLATVTVFSNPHIDVTGVSAAAAADGFTVTATGRVR